MPYYRKIIVAGGLAVFVLTGIAATHAHSDEDEKPKNLQVLSKKTSREELEVIMGRIGRELGVACSYCHAFSKPGNIDSDMDFASDSRPEKNIARRMLKMTLQLNRKYFNDKIDGRLLKKPVIWCGTCHRGFPRPFPKRPPVYRP